MQVKKQQLEMNMEQRTVSKLGKEYVKGVYCHLAIKPVNPKGNQPLIFIGRTDPEAEAPVL